MKIHLIRRVEIKIEKLVELMAALRDPASGCPWDLEQTFATIAPYTVEEAYEVADAIEREDLAELRDELGDLLFQVVFHARMAEEAGAFDFGDVVAGIVSKMRRRHPHVFGGDGDDPADARAVVQAWEEHKAAERRERRQASLLGDVARALPALQRAQKLTRRAATVGFDWPMLAQVRAKLDEELAELDEALAEAGVDRGTRAKDTPGRLDDAGAQAKVCEEFGDLLFVMANLARHLRVDAESALQGANAKFMRRFAYIEDALAARGVAPEAASLEEMDRLWDEAKERLG